MRLLLARHGQSVWHHDNRYVSRTDIGLTQTGYEQARALASRVSDEGVDLVLSSPLSRALETAKPAAEALGVQLRTDERLRELDFGLWEAKTFSEIQVDDPERAARFLDDASFGFPGGEPLGSGAGRAIEVFGDLSRQNAGETVLVVAHNTLLRLAICRILGVPLGRYRRLMPRLVNGAVSEVRYGAAGGALYSLNDGGGFGGSVA